MKKALTLLLIAGLPILFSQQAPGQARLKVTALFNFPSIPDTAFEGQHYDSIHIVIQNIGNATFSSSDINVLLYSTSMGIGNKDTLRWTSFPHTILAGQSISLNNVPSNYYFRTIHYAAGDNIIVVWPYSVQTSNYQVDSFYTNIYFKEIVGIQELNGLSVKIYPNPVSRILKLNYGSEKTVEQVRIYDLAGREIFNVREAVRSVDISSFDEGIYFLEVSEKNGKRGVQKILITKN